MRAFWIVEEDLVLRSRMIAPLLWTADQRRDFTLYRPLQFQAAPCLNSHKTRRRKISALGPRDVFKHDRFITAGGCIAWRRNSGTPTSAIEHKVDDQGSSQESQCSNLGGVGKLRVRSPKSTPVLGFRMSRLGLRQSRVSSEVWDLHVSGAERFYKAHFNAATTGSGEKPNRPFRKLLDPFEASG